MPNLIILNIDGLKPTVLADGLASGVLPHLASILVPSPASPPIAFPLISPAPSTTFTCQGSFLTGASPSRHRVVGNQFFDRLGTNSHGKPRHYGLDVGDSLSYDDAVGVFRRDIGVDTVSISGSSSFPPSPRLIGGLADRLMPSDLPTIFQSAASGGLTSAAIHFMYGRGSSAWVRPSLIDLARFKRGGSMWGLSPEAFDRRMVERLRGMLSCTAPPPHLLLLYFMGLDMTSHLKGPQAQGEYLMRVIDPLVGEALTILANHGYRKNSTFIVMSDHGQIAVTPDERHALRIGNPFTKPHRDFCEMLTSGGGRLHRFPATEGRSEVICTPNGGLAHLYLRDRATPWHEPPSFEARVLPLALTLAGAAGGGSADVPVAPDAFSAVLVRNTAAHGWRAPYRGVSPSGVLVPLPEFFAEPRFASYSEPANRIGDLAVPESGDIILLANGDKGYAFGGPLKGQHGGLHHEESLCTFAVGTGWLSGDERLPVGGQKGVERIIEKSLDTERAQHQRHYNTLADVAAVTKAVLTTPAVP